MKQERFPVLKFKHVSISPVVAPQCLLFFPLQMLTLPFAVSLFFAVLLEKVSSSTLFSTLYGKLGMPFYLFLTHFNSLEWFNVRKERGHIIYFISFVLELHLRLEVSF